MRRRGRLSDPEHAKVLAEKKNSTKKIASAKSDRPTQVLRKPKSSLALGASSRTGQDPKKPNVRAKPPLTISTASATVSATGIHAGGSRATASSTSLLPQTPSTPRTGVFPPPTPRTGMFPPTTPRTGGFLLPTASSLRRSQSTANLNQGNEQHQDRPTPSPYGAATVGRAGSQRLRRRNAVPTIHRSGPSEISADVEGEKRGASRLSMTDAASSGAKKTRLHAKDAEDDSVNRITRRLSDMTTGGQTAITTAQPAVTEAQQHIQNLENLARSMAAYDPARTDLIAAIAFMRKQFPPGG